MHIYLASRGILEHEGPGYCKRMVIIAKDVEQAKRLAAESAFGEGPTYVVEQSDLSQKYRRYHDA